MALVTRRGWEYADGLTLSGLSPTFFTAQETYVHYAADNSRPTTITITLARHPQDGRIRLIIEGDGEQVVLTQAHVQAIHDLYEQIEYGAARAAQVVIRRDPSSSRPFQRISDHVPEEELLQLVEDLVVMT
jgi:hypothetical protein